MNDSTTVEDTPQEKITLIHRCGMGSSPKRLERVHAAIRQLYALDANASTAEMIRLSKDDPRPRDARARDLLNIYARLLLTDVAAGADTAAPVDLISVPFLRAEAGDAVRLAAPWPGASEAQVGWVGVLDGMIGWTQQYGSITFNASTYRDDGQLKWKRNDDKDNDRFGDEVAYSQRWCWPGRARSPAPDSATRSATTSTTTAPTTDVGAARCRPGLQRPAGAVPIRTIERRG